MKNKQYVSDILDKSEISKWKGGNNILLSTEVGSGKTYWAINTLSKYAKTNNKRVLYLVHRKSLYNQISEDIGASKHGKVIDLMTYQKLTYDYSRGRDIGLDYDYIVCDEFQFLITDSDFITDTEVVIDLLNDNDLSKKIFISANLFDIGLKYDFSYTNSFKRDISNRINSAYSFDNYDNIKIKIEDILNNTDEKILVYTNDSSMIKELYESFSQHSSVIVSDSNILSKLIDCDEKEHLAKNNRFENRVLLCTSAIDSGVSIKDRKLKHIIVDELQIEQLYQVLGRKRLLDEEDRFDIYIKNYSNKEINGHSLQLRNTTNKIKLFVRDRKSFFKKHGRNLDTTIFYINTEGVCEINHMSLRRLIHLKCLYEEYIKTNYIQTLEAEFNITITAIEKNSLDVELDNYLKSILNDKLFSDQRETLIKKVGAKDSRGRLQKSYTKVKDFIESNTDFSLEKEINYVRNPKKLYNRTYWIVT